MQYFDLPKAYSFKLKSMNRGRQYAGTITNSCSMPYKTVVIDYRSNCLLCTCDGWLPIPVGQVQDFDTLDAVLSSPIAKILQNDIDNKKFTWCAVDHCGIKHNDIIKNTYELQINLDESCNLWCPSCRRDPILHVQGDEFDKKKKDLDQILRWLDRFENPIRIVLSGNGDPLASLIIRPLFYNFRPKSTQQFVLKTNGLLLEKQLSASYIMDNIINFSISVDAGSPEVYHAVRKGAKWESLIKNLDFLREREKTSITVLNFAVQNSNFRDIEKFADLCDRYGFKGILHQLDDWGTWNTTSVMNPDNWTIKNGTFYDHNVLNRDHVNYFECREVLIASQRYPYIRFSPNLLEVMTE